MNRDEQIEQRLSRQPVKPIPSTWREEILCAAREASVSRHATRNTQHGPWWRERFAFHPRAWATLGAAWVVILTLNFANRDTSGSAVARGSVVSAPHMQDALRQKQQVFAELAGLGDRPDANRPKTPVPRPRSDWRSGFVNA